MYESGVLLDDRDTTMAKRPPNLIYSVDEIPPAWTAILLALQHVVVISVGWIFPVVIVHSIGGTREQTTGMIQMSMIASGLGTILQARTLGLWGRDISVLTPLGPRLCCCQFETWSDDEIKAVWTNRKASV